MVLNNIHVSHPKFDFKVKNILTWIYIFRFFTIKWQTVFISVIAISINRAKESENFKLSLLEQSL